MGNKVSTASEKLDELGRLASKIRRNAGKKAKENVEKITEKITHKAEKRAAKRREEIDKEVYEKKRRRVIMLVGNPGAGKRTLVKTFTRNKSYEQLFTYKLNSFDINEYGEPTPDVTDDQIPYEDVSSKVYKHLNAVMSVIRQKNMLNKSEYEIKEGDINYDEMKDPISPLLIAAYYHSERSDDLNKPFPDELCEMIIAFMSNCVNSYLSESSFEMWHAEHSNFSLLSPLFVYCHAIVFVLDISAYNVYIADEKTGDKVNKLSYDLDVFEKMIEDVAGQNLYTQIIVLFNKADLFKKKLQNVSLNVCDLFSDYSYADKDTTNDEVFDPIMSLYSRHRVSKNTPYEDATQQLRKEIIRRVDKKLLRVGEVFCFATNANDKDMVKKTFADVAKVVDVRLFRRAIPVYYKDEVGPLIRRDYISELIFDPNAPIEHHRCC